MLGLSLRKLEITADTNDGQFGVTIPFKTGLNIIRAENSTGKSTCVNAIAYGLGLEAILGPGRKRTFAKSLYEVVLDKKEGGKPFYVHGSRVRLTVRNADGKEVILTRDILGNENKVSVEIETKSRDYFLGSSGKIGSAKNDRGFHHWLAKFIGWELPQVVTFDGGTTKLYLECIFPLFFIEQKRGWSELQANTPTYGIKNVKRVAAEFCLSIDRFQFEKKRIQLKKSVEDRELEWNNLRTMAKRIADLHAVHVTNLSKLSRNKGRVQLSFEYLENDVLIGVEAKEQTLKFLLVELESEEKRTIPSDDRLESQLATTRNARRELDRVAVDLELNMRALQEIEAKQAILIREYEQYQQLNVLKKVGSENDLEVDGRLCPICDSELFDSLGQKSPSRTPMTLDENIDFLKNQLDFYSSIKLAKLRQQSEMTTHVNLLNSKLRNERNTLTDMKTDLEDLHGESKATIRRKIIAERELRDVASLMEKRDALNDEAREIRVAWEEAVSALNNLAESGDSNKIDLIIRKFQSLLRGNLTDFRFSDSAVDSVSISKHSLRPEQEGYDIVAETSASDYIRIIWSYTLALLELASKNGKVKHGGFIVFDEPRQHETSRISFAGLIGKAAESIDFSGQVIFATSMNKGVIDQLCKDINVNLIDYEVDEYLLQPVKTDSSIAPGTS